MFSFKYIIDNYFVIVLACKLTIHFSKYQIIIKQLFLLGILFLLCKYEILAD